MEQEMLGTTPDASPAPFPASPAGDLASNLLREMEAFRRFPAEGLDRLARAGHARTFPAGSRLMEQGETAESLYVILAGRVRVQRAHPQLRTPLVLAEFGEGEVVGEMGILDRAPRSATVIALEPVCALELPAEALFDAMREFPGTAGALLGLLSRRLRELDEVIEESLSQLHEQHELILSTVEEGIWLLDATGRVTFVNPAGARMLGHSVDELSGRSFHDLVHPQCHRPADECRLAAPLGDSQVQYGIDEGFSRADGSAFPAEFTGNPIWEQGRPVGAVITVRDVTERRAVERMKDEFVSIVSHELRTPLTSIRGSLGLLTSGQLGDLPERAQHMLEIADTNTDRLIRLINDLLDIERMESGRATLERADTDVGRLMTAAGDLMRPMADMAGVSLVVDPVDAPLLADPDRILQTLSNLLSNAIKFSPPGGHVWLEAEPDGDWIQFRVRDEGRGIPADKLGAIFGRFQQVDSSDAREKGGTGLGLPICRSIVQQHGGRIWVESEPGRGSTFRFTLPRPLDGSVAWNTEVASRTGSDPVRWPARPTVLLAEDDSDLAQVLVQTFEGRGATVYRAGTGHEAIQLARRVRPDALVLEVNLPHGDGYFVVDQLRQHGRLRTLPVVVYSAKDLDDGERCRLSLGETLFFTKGRVPPCELEARVAELLDGVLLDRCGCKRAG